MVKTPLPFDRENLECAMPRTPPKPRTCKAARAAVALGGHTRARDAQALPSRGRELGC